MPALGAECGTTRCQSAPPDSRQLPPIATDRHRSPLVATGCHRSYGKSRNQVLEWTKAGDHDTAVALMFTETNALQTVYIDAWKTFIDHEKQQLASGVERAEGNYHQATGVRLACSRWRWRPAWGRRSR